MPIERLPENPLLSPEDLKPTAEGLEVFCTLNPAAIRFGDQTLLLVRVGERAVPDDHQVAYVYYDVDAGKTQIKHIPLNDLDLDTSDPRKYRYKNRTLLTSMSHLRIARSTDGRSFTFDPQPAIYPSTPYEAYGVEDARITFIDGRYYVAYTAVSDRGVAVGLSSTTDFESFENHGVIFPPYQKDVALFPEKIRGMYCCRHRPYMNEFNPASIWTGYSPDLLSWGRHEMTLPPTPGTWEGERVGCGAPPIKTAEGWLEIYHAADAAGRYALGAMLSDLDYPERILSRSENPIFEPKADYELAGVFANCVFSNGLVAEEDGTLRIYYGAADRICAAAVTTVEEMIDAALNR